MPPKYPLRQTGSFHYVSKANDSPTQRPLVIEYYVDYTCPFSAKIFNTLSNVYPKLDPDFSVAFVVHQLPQPWHPQSTMTHEVSLAVRQVEGDDKYIQFSQVLFEAQKDFFDDNVWNKTRDELYKMLIGLVKQVEVDEEKVMKLLGPNLEEKAKGALNYGNAITAELKAVVKLHRKRGVHVTPTVFVNGIEATEVSSGWSVDQWLEFLGGFGVKNNL